MRSSGQIWISFWAFRRNMGTEFADASLTRHSFRLVVRVIGFLGFLMFQGWVSVLLGLLGWTSLDPLKTLTGDSTTYFSKSQYDGWAFAQQFLSECRVPGSVVLLLEILDYKDLCLSSYFLVVVSWCSLFFLIFVCFADICFVIWCVCLVVFVNFNFSGGALLFPPLHRTFFCDDNDI